MTPTSLITLLATIPLLHFAFVHAATAESWRSRSIYQLITDRFALPASDPPLPTDQCHEGNQTWCGGTWAAIEQNLDYIEGMGFTAIWISPVAQNIPGPTAYGNPYHGYWVQNVTQLNDKFGTPDDLKSLVSALHSRGMYIMVDIVVNNVAATSSSFTPDYSCYLFTDESYYHSYTPIDWGNATSEEIGWLGDTKLPLPDLNTSNPNVRSTLQTYIKEFVEEYSIDGLRIDAAKHVEPDFWPSFCNEGGAAGVFCIGEVYGPDVKLAAQWQGPLDSVLNYPAYYAIHDAFGIPGPANISGLIGMLNQSKATYKDVSVLGNFLENHDLPRWAGVSTDPQTLTNALVFSFMNDGIPVIYYGLEQGFAGAADPYNREPLWPSKYVNTTAYQTIASLNKLRTFLANRSDWATQPASVISASSFDLAINKGGVISIMNTLGSSPKNISSVVSNTGYGAGVPLVDILTCDQYIVASHGSLSVSYSHGAKPVVLFPLASLGGSGLCDETIRSGSTNPISPKARQSFSYPQATYSMLSAALALVLFSFILLGI